jgi:hypothetical protein
MAGATGEVTTECRRTEDLSMMRRTVLHALGAVLALSLLGGPAAAQMKLDGATDVPKFAAPYRRR